MPQVTRDKKSYRKNLFADKLLRTLTKFIRVAF